MNAYWDSQRASVIVVSFTNLESLFAGSSAAMNWAAIWMRSGGASWFMVLLWNESEPPPFGSGDEFNQFVVERFNVQHIDIPCLGIYGSPDEEIRRLCFDYLPIDNWVLGPE
jgi:hypothetical protein